MSEKNTNKPQANKTQQRSVKNQNKSNKSSKSKISKPFYYKHKKTVKKQQKQPAQFKAKHVKIAFLGGINEVGKNMTV
ncbi:MAG: hypothetical protein NC185_02645, partial [Ruminococcus sp.]|nr:hypothetical protein [Ruminococcus sp.]